MPENFTPLSLALVAGAFYGLSALFSKRALETGAGTFRSLVWSNWAITLAFVPFPFLADRSIEAEALLPGMLLGVIFFFAQMACFLALRRGDASVVTSVIGSKSLFVAFFLVLLGFRESLPGKIWIAALLAAVAVALLSWPSQSHRPALSSVALATFTAASFGLTDALVPHFVKSTHPLNLLFVMVATVGILSVPVIPFCRGRFMGWRRSADKWLLWGSLLVAGQAILMSIAIGFYNIPTEANIVYASRGLWSILFAVWIGSRIGVSEASAPKPVIVRRVLGAGLLIAGICLVG